MLLLGSSVFQETEKYTAKISKTDKNFQVL